MKIRCQQQDILKVRLGIPGHGPQDVLGVFKGISSRRVALACKCCLPVSWLPKKEQRLLEAYQPPTLFLPRLEQPLRWRVFWWHFKVKFQAWVQSMFRYQIYGD